MARKRKIPVIPKLDKVKEGTYKGFCPDVTPPQGTEITSFYGIWIPTDYLIDRVKTSKAELGDLYKSAKEYITGGENSWAPKDTVYDAKKLATSAKWETFFLKTASEFDYSPYIKKIREKLEQRNEHFKTNDKLKYIDVKKLI